MKAKKIGNIISSIVLLILLVIAGILYVPRFFGITPTVVLSGSMEPTFPVGSLIFVEKINNPAELNVKDNVTFYFNNTKTIVTHRIIEKNSNEKYFITKGDNNNTKDPSNLLYTNVIGKAYNFAIPYLGYLATYASTPFGMMLIIGLAVIILLITLLTDTKTKKKGAV